MPTGEGRREGIRQTRGRYTGSPEGEARLVLWWEPLGKGRNGAVACRSTPTVINGQNGLNATNCSSSHVVVLHAARPNRNGVQPGIQSYPLPSVQVLNQLSMAADKPVTVRRSPNQTAYTSGNARNRASSSNRACGKPGTQSCRHVGSGQVVVCSLWVVVVG